MEYVCLHSYRNRAAAKITQKPGVYVLCDLDQIPIYVGQSKDGIRTRVRRHLTSARSDVIANRQLDVWEVAYVWTFPTGKENCDNLEAFLYHHFNDEYLLMNGVAPKRPRIHLYQAPDPDQIIEILPKEEIKRRLDPAIRAPRQIAQYQILVDYFLNVKKNKATINSLGVHFFRLRDMHKSIISVLPFDDEED